MDKLSEVLKLVPFYTKASVALFSVDDPGMAAKELGCGFVDQPHMQNLIKRYGDYTVHGITLSVRNNSVHFLIAR